MNPYQKHKVKWLSPSQINTMNECPNYWVLQKLIKAMPPFQGNSATSRGQAVEKAITAKLMHDLNDKDCIDIGLAEYDKLMALVADKNKESERENIPLMYEQLIDPLADYGKPLMADNPRNQHSTQLIINGFPKIIGYIDLLFNQINTIVDIKTTLRLPSSIPDSHARQGAIYAQSTGFRMVFAYVTPKKFAFYELTDVDKWLNQIRGILTRMERLLAVSDNPSIVAEHIIPNYSSWAWKDEQVRKVGVIYNKY